PRFSSSEAIMVTEAPAMSDRSPAIHQQENLIGAWIVRVACQPAWRGMGTARVGCFLTILAV
ncbi:MAG: hypothetical protein ACPG3U_09285, partial [Rhodothermales bacterium]